MITLISKFGVAKQNGLKIEITMKIFSNVYKGKKVLVTGNTGFKGSWLTSWLLELGAEVIGISHNIPTKPSMFQELKLNKHITNFNIDIRNQDTLEKIISENKPDFIFHLAAQAIVSTSYLDPIDTITSNVLGTTNILESLRKINKECIAIIITSDKCYDNVEWVWGYREFDSLGGKDIYSGSKAAAELICKSFYHSYFSHKNSNVKIATVRAGNVIGGGDWAQERIIPDCIRAWSKNKYVTIRSPHSTRPWQHVLEPLSGYLCLGMELSLNRKTQLNGESYNFGPSNSLNKNVLEIIKDLRQFWSPGSQKLYFKIQDKNKFHEAGLLKLNCDKALFDLKWRSVLSYNDLISYTGKWYDSYYNNNVNMFDFTVKQINNYVRKASEENLNWLINKDKCH